jgi:hypothetical protein
MGSYDAWYKAERRAQWILDNGPCAWCGTWEDLEVDHIDPSTKTIRTSLIWQTNEEQRVAELAGCQVLCKKCHRQKTTIEAESKVQHGTLHMYNSPRYKCRCDACKLAYANYQRQYRARKAVRISESR